MQAILAPISLAAVLSAPQFVDAAGAAPLDGSWVYEWPCGRAMGLYAERCAEGVRDEFALSIFVRGSEVCGSYELTAQMTNRVDAGDLRDWHVQRLGKSRSYRVQFHVEGTNGQAVIRVRGSKLYWKTLTQTHDSSAASGGRSVEPPKSAILVRQPVGNLRRTPRCMA
ncbi:MAG TPA: hypothetical protein VFW19_18475 [Allosphingosinicella sp.]|nr:hypothetical protein [Allosphingosinicella sp.]